MQHVSRLHDNKLEVTLENLIVCRPLISDICSGLSGDWTQNEETFARPYVATLSLTRLWNLIHLSLLGLSGIRISLVSLVYKFHQLLVLIKHQIDHNSQGFSKGWNHSENALNKQGIVSIAT